MTDTERSAARWSQTHHCQPTPNRNLRRARIMRSVLINPLSPLVSILNAGERRWNHYRVWKPLGLCRCLQLGEAVRRIQAHGILVAGSFVTFPAEKW